MSALILILRIIHLFAGVFWVGFGIFNIQFLQPAVRATGADGQKVMQYLSQKTRFQITVYSAATLTVLSGLALYWIQTGFRAGALSSGYGLIIGLGGIAGIVAWLLAVFVIGGIFRRMAAVGQAIQAQGGPPTADQTAQMQALTTRLGKTGRIAVTFALISVLGMAIGRYIQF